MRFYKSYPLNSQLYEEVILALLDTVVHGRGSVTSMLRRLRVGTVRISTGMAPREQRGGHACKIAKWKTGVRP